jgi:ADP-L-glycero-D-manno-heptose 6-epimerase
VFKALDKQPQIEYTPMPKDLIGQYQNYTRAEMDKYLQTHKLENGQTPCQYSVDEGVADYVRNYLLKDQRW